MKLIDKEQLTENKTAHKVISTKVVEGKIQIHVYSATQPDSSFTALTADLEDVYFATISNQVDWVKWGNQGEFGGKK